MIPNDVLYTPVSDGQVHIALGTRYIGSVDSYNYCFTQLLAWLFRQSIAVNFDGKLISLNKESYTKLVKALTRLERIDDIYEYRVFKGVIAGREIPENPLKMRQVISRKDSHSLFQSLAHAIANKDEEKATAMICMGAQLDTVYFDRGELPPSFERDATGLNRTTPCKFSVFQAPPILQAADKRMNAIALLLQQAGANKNLPGMKYIFERTTKNVQTHVELVPENDTSSQSTEPGEDGGQEPKKMFKRVDGSQLIALTEDSRKDYKHSQLLDNLRLIED